MDKGRLIGGAIIAGLFLGGAYLVYHDGQRERKEKLEMAFRAIPQVYKLDSSYSAATKTYHLERDSLRKMYNDHLEEIVGRK